MSNRSSHAASSEEISHKHSFIGRGLDDSLQKGFGLLSGVIRAPFHSTTINPNILNYLPITLIQETHSTSCSPSFWISQIELSSLHSFVHFFSRRIWPNSFRRRGCTSPLKFSRSSIPFPSTIIQLETPCRQRVFFVFIKTFYCTIFQFNQRVLFQSCLRQRSNNINIVVSKFVTFTIPKYCVVYPSQFILCIIMRVSSLPNNFIYEPFFAKDFIHKNLHIMNNMPIQMHIDACILAHHTFDSHEVLVHPVEVTLLVPNIAIHLLLEILHIFVIEILLGILDGFPHKRIAADIDFLGIIGSAGKGRVDIN